MPDNLNIYGQIYQNAAGIKAYDENGNLLPFINVSNTTATANRILQGYGAYGADGAWMDGTAGFRILDFINDKSTSTSDSVGFGYGVNVSTMAAAGFTSSKKQTRSVSILKGSYIIFIQCKIEYGNFTVTSNSEGFSFLTEYANSSTTWRKCYFINSSFPITGGTITVSPSQDPFPENVSTEPLSVTANGTYTAPSGTAYTPVTVAVPTPTPSLQSKSVSPSETAQTVTPDSGYDGLSQVSIGAISSTYVGSGIDRNDSTDLTASGATVTVPAGYYENSATKTIISGTEGTPTATKGTVSSHSITITPSVTNTAGYISGGTHTGTGVTVQASELVSGTYSVDSSGTKDITNYASVSVPSGIAGTPSAAKGTVSNNSITVTPSVTNVTGYITGGTKTGTGVTVSASELVSGTYTVNSSGTKDVTNYASISVSAGTAGTPSATKGTVSNHSISVTPSVTNTTGWITGSTKSGTAVTVSASELVSGSETKTSNGTYDVTNLASLQVAIPIVTYYTGSSAPSSSLGQNGDIYLQT